MDIVQGLTTHTIKFQTRYGYTPGSEPIPITVECPYLAAAATVECPYLAAAVTVECPYLAAAVTLE